jgi:hypothetical protein
MAINPEPTCTFPDTVSLPRFSGHSNILMKLTVIGNQVALSLYVQDALWPRECCGNSVVLCLSGLEIPYPLRVGIHDLCEPSGLAKLPCRLLSYVVPA